MRRIRSRLTYANVMVTILAFLVLGGGTALGAFVVSSNSQVASGTISGHKPPTGKHSNIIAGSVNGTDLATSSVGIGKLAGNSVNSPKVVNGSLTGADLNKADVSQSLGLRRGSAFASLGDPPVSIYDHGEYSLSGECVQDGVDQGYATISLSSTSPQAAFLAVDGSGGEKFTGTPSTPLVSGSTSAVSNTKAADFSVLGLSGTYLQGRVQATFLDAIDSGGPAAGCAFTFAGFGD